MKTIIKSIILILLLSVSTSCKKKIIIPEFSNFLITNQEFPKKTNKKPKAIPNIRKIFKTFNSLFYLDFEHKLYQLNTKNQESKLCLQLPSIKNFFHLNNHILLTTKTNSHFVLNLESSNLNTKEILKKDILKPLCLNEKYLIYINKINTVSILNIESNKILKKTPSLKNQKIKDAFITDDNIIIIYSKTVFSINLKSLTLKKIKLPYSIYSSILLKNNFIYFCNPNKLFIKFSLKSKKIHWKRKLPHNFLFKPAFFNKHLVVVLRDNNVYFFSMQGILKWNKELDKTILQSPLVLKDSIAVMTYPKKSPIINIFSLKYRLKFSYQTELRLTDPLYFENKIFFRFKDSINFSNQIHSISNIYATYMELSPKTIKPINRAIEINLKSINLIDANYSVNILDKNFKSVFKQKIEFWEKPSLQFYPKDTGKYIIELSIYSENRENFVLKNHFYVHDLSLTLNNFYRKLQIDSSTDNLKFDHE